jgi:hypothetical protein
MNAVSQRWWWRAGLAGVAWVGFLVAGARLDLDPHPGRLLLVIALVAAVAGLLVDSAVDPTPQWHRDHPDRDDWRGHDQRTAYYVRMLESHLTARDSDPALRDRLVRLGEARDVVVDPPVRLSREEIDAWIGRIERR